MALNYENNNLRGCEVIFGVTRAAKSVCLYYPDIYLQKEINSVFGIAFNFQYTLNKSVANLT